MKYKKSFLFASSLLLLTNASQAQTVWTGATNGTWATGTTGNWTGGTGTDFTTGDAVQFNETTGAILAITVDAAGVSPVSVNFTDGGGGTKAYTFTNASGAVGIAGAGSVTLDSGFGGSARFNSANTYSGGTTLNAGTLIVANNTSLGTGTLTLDGGIFFTATVSMNLGNAVNVTGNTRIFSKNGNATLSGAITGNGTLTGGGEGAAAATFIITNNMSGFTGTVIHNNVNGLNNLTFNGTVNTTAKFQTTGATVSNRNLRFNANATIGELSGTGGVVFGDNTILTINQSTNTTFAGVFQDVNDTTRRLAIVKSGSGTLTLTAANLHRQSTTVTGGKLSVGPTGSINSTTGVTIGTASTAAAAEFNYNSSTALTKTVSFAAGSTGGILSGSGTINNAVDVTAGNTLAIGNSVGQMNFGDTLALNGTTVMEIDGDAGAGIAGGHDFANLTGVVDAGVLSYGGALTLDIGMVFGTGSYTWNLFDFASETGDFATITLADQYSGSLTNGGGGIWGLTSGDNIWQFTESTGVLGLTVVPEPSAALLGCIGMLFLLRRRR